MRAPLRAAVTLALLASLTASLAQAEVSQKDGVRVKVEGNFAPTALPRQGSAPIAVSLAGRIGATNPGGPPQLHSLQVAINREGHLSSRGIPLCRLGHIDPSTNSEARAACGRSLVGEGHFSADVKLPEQSPFPSEGKVLAFNGRYKGKPAVFAHIYGTDPVPTSYVLPFLIKSTSGRFGTLLETSFPQVTGEWGFVTGISIDLDRRYSFRGHRRSFLSAGCPAPGGLRKAPFPLMRTTFSFADGLNITNTLIRTCRASG